MSDVSAPRRPSATELNEQIRGLLQRSGGRLGDSQRAEYQLLLQEWAKAVREDFVAAA